VDPDNDPFSHKPGKRWQLKTTWKARINAPIVDFVPERGNLLNVLGVFDALESENPVI
jgi:hypothetical protein